MTRDRPSAAREPVRYWSDRAIAFGGGGQGLGAVCSYGMPEFYNRSIDFLQRRALARHLRGLGGLSVLDVGCGVGRWSRRMARRGAQVTGADISPAMLAEANRRTRSEGLAGRCRFVVARLDDLCLGHRYDLVLAVTVLQHIVDVEEFERSVAALAAHLAPGGRLVLLEAAPDRVRPDVEGPMFRARTRFEYLRTFEAAGLELVGVGGVDPIPAKLWVLPHYRNLSSSLRLAALAGATAISLPLDLLLARVMVARSWHKVFELRLAAPAAGLGRDPLGASDQSGTLESGEFVQAAGS